MKNADVTFLEQVVPKMKIYEQLLYGSTFLRFLDPYRRLFVRSPFSSQ